MAHPAFMMDGVDIAPTVFHPREVAVLDEIGNDCVNGAFGDTDRLSRLPQGQLTVTAKHTKTCTWFVKNVQGRTGFAFSLPGRPAQSVRSALAMTAHQTINISGFSLLWFNLREERSPPCPPRPGRFVLDRCFADVLRRCGLPVTGHRCGCA